MSLSEKKAKREKAMYKMANQLSVLSRAGKKSQQRYIKQMQALFDEMQTV